MYEVKLKQFSGPLQKLLELVEARTLEITQVNLGAVTGDFLSYLERSKDTMEPVLLADFLVTAAKLLLIKSRVLVPAIPLSADEEGDIRDLESRLKLYQEFTAGTIHVKRLWRERAPAYTRPLFSHLGERAIFYPPPGITPAHLGDAIRLLLAACAQFLTEPEVARRTIISIEAKVREVMERLEEGITQFHTLTNTRSRQEVIALFLALLHLLKEKQIEVEQPAHFDAILLKKL